MIPRHAIVSAEGLVGSGKYRLHPCSYPCATGSAVSSFEGFRVGFIDDHICGHATVRVRTEKTEDTVSVVLLGEGYGGGVSTQKCLRRDRENIND